VDTFTFSYTQRPDLVNVDGDKILLCEKTDNKTAENFIQQMKYAPLYLDRREALDFFAKKGMKELADGLKDKYEGLREYTVNKIAGGKLAKDAAIIEEVAALAAKEKDKKAKAAALQFLAATGDAKFLSLFKANIADSSYRVAGAALGGIAALEPDNAYALAKKYSVDAKGDLGVIIGEIVMDKGLESDFEIITATYDNLPLSQEKIQGSATYAAYLEKIQDIANVKKGIDKIVKFRNLIPEQFRGFVDPTIKGGLDKLGKAKGTEIAEYIKAAWK
jgi:aminopeptidase N